MAMAKSCDYSVAVASAALLFLPSLLLHCAAASGTVHVVGDIFGWIVPSSNPQLYTNWSSSYTFQLNDVLTFNFSANRHDVVKVPKESYDACNTNNQIGETITTSPANVTLNQTGIHYFICSYPGHCGGGQRLAVTVSSSAPSPDASSPPPPSSVGPPAIAGAFFFVLLSFALGQLVL